MSAIDLVVVTGVGAVTSLGGSLDETWKALLRGARGIRTIRRFDPTAFPARNAAEVATISREAVDEDNRHRIGGRQTATLLASSKEALRSAGIEETTVGREEIGFFAALGGVDCHIDELLPAVSAARTDDGALNYREFFLEHYRKIPPFWLLSLLNNIAFCQVAIALDIQGENTVLSQHGDAGAQAIAEGVAAVHEGRARIALAGGVSEEITPSSLARYLLLNLLSTRSHGECRPFAADRSGTVMGEGGGALVLERASTAARRDVQCLAELSAVASSCELDENGGAPTAAAIERAMAAALSAAGTDPDSIDLIIANGDGSPIGDEHERTAIESLFKRSLDSVKVLSLKGAVGHLFAGAPLLDTALGVRIIQEGFIPGMASDLTPQPDSRLKLLIGGPTSHPVSRILINAQGFAGQCVSVVLSSIAHGKG